MPSKPAPTMSSRPFARPTQGSAGGETNHVAGAALRLQVGALACAVETCPAREAVDAADLDRRGRGRSTSPAST